MIKAKPDETLEEKARRWNSLPKFMRTKLGSVDDEPIIPIYDESGCLVVGTSEQSDRTSIPDEAPRVYEGQDRGHSL